MRGHRLAELCAGDFFEGFQELCHITAARLHQLLPAQLSGPQFATMVREFEKGRSHHFFTLVLKLAPVMEPPLCLPACSHHDMAKACKFVETCLEGNSRHP